MTEQKRGRGRPPKDNHQDTSLTMLVMKSIESGSGLKPAALELQLLDQVVGEPQPGARWSRYARGDRTMNSVRLEQLYRKAVKAGYLPKLPSGLNSTEFGFLSLGISVEQLTAKLVLANATDRALVKQVAEVRSMVRALRSTLVELGEGYWDSVCETDEQNYCRQSKLLDNIDNFDESLSSLRFNSLYFDQTLRGGR